MPFFNDNSSKDEQTPKEPFVDIDDLMGGPLEINVQEHVDDAEITAAFADVEKINVQGEVKVLSYILYIIKAQSDFGRMEFTKTMDESQAVPKFTVTLGVMPDYLFDGEGMKIDGVTDGKPASKAGMVAGDVVTKLGEVIVSDMMSYMKALSRYKKGDEVKVEYRRGEEQHSAKVKF